MRLRYVAEQLARDDLTDWRKLVAHATNALEVRAMVRSRASGADPDDVERARSVSARALERLRVAVA
jgi:hypothetical protein